MKYICFSFDDARSDTYDVAFPIMKKYGIKATLNVISDYVIAPQNYSFASAPKAMTKEQILAWQDAGHEVACHGKTHHNTVKDILDNIEDLKTFGVDVSGIGFASPNSELTADDIQATGIGELKRDGTIAYIRSGIQVRREGSLYMMGAVLEKITHSKRLYWELNKKNIVEPDGLPDVIPSVAVKGHTTVAQILYLIERMGDDRATVLMFHSILQNSLLEKKKTQYCWSAESFEDLCKYLALSQDIKTITTRELVTGGHNGR